MNASEILIKFHSFVSDSQDPDLELQLANDAMHEIEEDIQPEGLKVADTSKSTAVGQTYTTGITLPVDFFLPSDVIYIGDTPYVQVPFEKSVSYRNRSGFFYIDLANSVYRLCGIQSSVQTITFPYFYSTADLVVDPTPTSPVWPRQFHSLIPLRMAQMYYAIDGGEKGRTWDDRWNVYYRERLSRFRDYDARLKLAGMNRSTAPVENDLPSENRINI